MIRLGTSLDVPGTLMEALQELNPDYVVTRYPDAANGVPAEMFNRANSRLHLDHARKLVQWVSKQL